HRAQTLWRLGVFRRDRAHAAVAHSCTVARKLHRAYGLLALPCSDAARRTQHPGLPPIDAGLCCHNTGLGALPSHCDVVSVAGIPSCSRYTQIAIETCTVDKDLLFRISAGNAACAVANLILREAQRRVGSPLNGRIRRWWAVHSFHAHVRLDVPTFAQGHVRRQLEETSDGYNGQAVVWQSLSLVTGILSTLTQMAAQSVVLFHILQFQRDGVLLGVMTLLSETAYWVFGSKAMRKMRVWLATTFNDDYLRMRGWKRVISSTDHRQEFVAGNLTDHAMSEFKKASEKVGSRDADWNEIEDTMDICGYGDSDVHKFNVVHSHLYRLAVTCLQIIFTLCAAHCPATIPISLASLTLVQGAARDFAWKVYKIVRDTREFDKQLRAIRKIYEVINIPNLVPDGVIPFPEDTAKIRCGISIEFRNVSFKYPESDQYALHNISFRLDAGQLCVIVGANGSGKSTILKLVTRIYDPDEGQILLGGHDIRTLKLQDLRQAISVLFQDYTLFPLSICDNIAMGDPATSHDNDRVRLAVRVAGAEDLIDKLPDSFDTYLERPVDDEYSMVAEGPNTLTGRVVDYSALCEAANIKSSRDTSLSGGQMQRIAVARSFMRSVVQEDSTVGLLLFDEPSAALNPAAEHDLFNRLRELRGSKTMIFSSHRFGNLTRHADMMR
ncbi:P-loop containing nucleoside triphosphate hydrolase protein, partial [Fomes fomentarius]